MSDSDKLKNTTAPTEPADAEDESIIDLVEEIEETIPSEHLPALDQPLLAIDEASNAAAPPSPELLELAEIDFDEEEDPSEDEALLFGPVNGESDAPDLKEDMDWLLEPEAEAPVIESDHHSGVSAGERLESSEFTETDPETETIIDAMLTPATDTDSANVDDDIELIEIEDDTIEDTPARFDDLDMKQAPPSIESAAEAAAPETLLSDSDADLFVETSAADVFAANVASGLAAIDSAPADLPSPAAVIPTVAAMSSTPSTSPTQPPPSEAPPIADSISLSAEQIDAAVERVIERKLGGTLESIVLRAVETAVVDEIQRLKALLLDDDSGDRTP